MITAGVAICLNAAPCFAGSTANLSLELRVTSSPIGPIEPLRFRLVLTNTGKGGTPDLLAGEGGGWADYKTVTVEFRAPGTPDWRELEVPRLNLSMQLGSPEGCRTFSLAPGESLSDDMWVQYDHSMSYREGKAVYYFDEPGRHTLRARYVPAKYTRRPRHYPTKEELARSAKGVVIHSNEAALVVKEYRGADAAAFRWLRKLPIPHFMYDEGALCVGNDAPHGNARHVITHFPESRFAPWAKLFLAKCYRYGIYRDKAVTPDPPDLDKAVALAREVTDTEDPRLRRAARELLLAVARERAVRRHDEAEARLRKAREELSRAHDRERAGRRFQEAREELSLAEAWMRLVRRHNEAAARLRDAEEELSRAYDRERAAQRLHEAEIGLREAQEELMQINGPERATWLYPGLGLAGGAGAAAVGAWLLLRRRRRGSAS